MAYPFDTTLDEQRRAFALEHALDLGKAALLGDPAADPEAGALVGFATKFETYLKGGDEK